MKKDEWVHLDIPSRHWVLMSTTRRMGVKKQLYCIGDGAAGLYVCLVDCELARVVQQTVQASIERDVGGSVIIVHSPTSTMPASATVIDLSSLDRRLVGSMQ
jgi:hypothetical protein